MRSPSAPHWLLALALALALAACVAPTLSKPRGAAHLDALAEAARHAHHGRHAEAAEAYQRAAEAAERPVDRDEALYRKSRVLARAGDLRAALAIYDGLAARDPPGRRTLRARLDAARLRLLLGEPERAGHALRQLAVAYPESGAARAALRLLTRLRIEEAGDLEEALAFLRALRAELDASELGERLMYLEADLLLRLERADEAEQLLLHQVARHPYPHGALWDDALSRLADLALARGAPRQAIEHLSRMVEAHERSLFVGSYTRPRMPEAGLRIARIYRDELSDGDAALRAYAAVRRAFPRSRVVDDALLEEAELRLARGERATGCELLVRLLETFPAGSARRRAETRLLAACRGA